MTESVVIHDATLVDDGRVVADGWLRIDGDRITRRGSGAGWPTGLPHHDAGGALIVPGFVDIHSHGGGGFSGEDGLDGMRGMLDFHRSRGTTSMIISLATAPVPELLERLAEIRSLAATDRRVLGAHLEGPFLDDAHRGAHDPSLLLTPTPDLVRQLLEVADGCLRQITIAPEHAEPEVLDLLLEAGVRVAVGHTSATREQAASAYRRGASILTHAFNGMPGIHHRAPGPVVAAIENGAVLEVIADGAHVDPTLVAMLFQLAPGRVALITDAMAAAGSADGEYRLGSYLVVVTDGIAMLADGSSLAGSTLTLDRAIRVATTAGVPLPEAIRAATQTPTQAIGATDIGSLAVGSFADIVQLDAALQVAAVWSGGKRL
jgi:N-acetylglucosamine-6-phosphate deacetylase